MDVQTSLMGDHLFRPETFFLGRTEGTGVLRDPFGRLQRRCEVVTVGERRAAYGALSLDETFTFDDGEVDAWRWVITSGGDGRYMASELTAGSGIIGQRHGDDYVIAFSRPHGRARGLTAPRYVSRFTLMAPDLALKTVKVSLLGAPVARMTVIHRRIR